MTSKTNRPTKDVNTRTKRPKRVPLSGARNLLSVEGKKENKVYRWVNDVSNRIDNFIAAYWDFTPQDETKVGDVTVNTTEAKASFVSKNVGNGIVAYLMNLDKELYNADQKAKEDSIRATQESMQRKINDNGDGTTYGKVEIK